MRRRQAGGRPDDRALTVVWTERALTDFDSIGDSIGDSIAAGSPLAADRWVREILAAVEKVTNLPLAGRSVPEVGRPDIREILKRTDRVVYRVGSDRLEVLTVFEGHRLFPESL